MATTTVSMTAPTQEYQLDQMQLQRQQAMADALRQRAMAPMEQQVVGGRVIPISHMQGLAKLAEALASRFTQDRVDQGSRDLQQKSNAALADTLMRFQNETDPMKRASIAMTDPRLQPLGIKLMEQLGTNDKFSKIDPKDYTADSVRNFARTGDFASLVPVRKMEYVHAGDKVYPRNPFETNQEPITVGMSPDGSANLAFNVYKYAHPSGLELAHLANEGARIGIERQRTNFDTGAPSMGGGAGVPKMPPVPQFGAVPPQMPAGVQMPPQAAPQAGIPQVPPGIPQSPQQMPQVPQRMPAPQGVPPAMQQGVLTPKMLAEKEANRGSSERAVQNTVSNIDNLLSYVGKVANAPGLNSITGPIGGRTFNLSDEANNAQAALDTLKAQVGNVVLQAMRDASKTGGAVGNVTEKEWPILQNQLGALQQTQTFAAFKANQAGVEQQLQKMRQLAIEAHNREYGSINVPAAPEPLRKEAATKQIGGTTYEKRADGKWYPK